MHTYLEGDTGSFHPRSQPVDKKGSQRLLHEVVFQKKQCAGKLRPRAFKRIVSFEKRSPGVKLLNHSCRRVFYVVYEFNSIPFNSKPNSIQFRPASKSNPIQFHSIQKVTRTSQTSVRYSKSHSNKSDLCQVLKKYATDKGFANGTRTSQTSVRSTLFVSCDPYQRCMRPRTVYEKHGLSANREHDPKYREKAKSRSELLQCRCHFSKGKKR